MDLHGYHNMDATVLLPYNRYLSYLIASFRTSPRHISTIPKTCVCKTPVEGMPADKTWNHTTPAFIVRATRRDRTSFAKRIMRIMPASLYNICIGTYICICVYVYIYTYRERDVYTHALSLSLSIYIYTHMTNYNSVITYNWYEEFTRPARD